MSQASREAPAGGAVMVWSMQARRSGNEAPLSGKGHRVAS